MIIIAHRAILDKDGKSYAENSPLAIKDALDNGFHVEIDLWYFGGEFWLGHNEPEYPLRDLSKLNIRIDHRFWVHCKDIQTAYAASYHLLKTLSIFLDKLPRLFIHNKDEAVFVSPYYILWTYPGYELTPYSIAVMPEKAKYSLEELQQCYGVCTDKPFYYRDLLC